MKIETSNRTNNLNKNFEKLIALKQQIKDREAKGEKFIDFSIGDPKEDIDKNNLPTDTTKEELKELIAKAASPKASADNVIITYTSSTDPYLTPESQQNLPKVD